MTAYRITWKRTPLDKDQTWVRYARNIDVAWSSAIKAVTRETGGKGIVLNVTEDTLPVTSAPDVDGLLLLLAEAVKRVEIANAEGDPILSAWLPLAKAAIAKGA